MKRLSLLACALLIVLGLAIPISAQRRLTKPQQTKAPALARLPADEELFADSEYEIGPGWRLAIRSDLDSKNERDIVYYDVARVTPLLNGYRAWLKRVREQNSKLLSQEISNQEYDCGSAKMRITQSFLYDAGGRQVESLGASSWNTVVPDTLTEYVYNIFCRGQRDKQWMDIVAAQRYFSWGRHDEKKQHHDSALHWYQIALQYAPNHPKIVAGIERITDPLGIDSFLRENPTPVTVSPEVDELRRLSEQAKTSASQSSRKRKSSTKRP